MKKTYNYDNDSQFQIYVFVNINYKGTDMKKNIFIRICLVFSMISMLCINCSCGFDTDDDKKISIVCTAFPQYDFVKEIVGERQDSFDITYLFDNGADVHSFEGDISFNVKIKILNSDLFIYNGGESDSWVNSILSDESMNKKCIKVSLLESIPKTSLLSLNHDESVHEHDDECEDEHSSSVDEHVWLSLINARHICDTIKNQISKLDPDYKNIYDENYNNYLQKLSELHDYCQSEISKFNSPFLVVADRFPFAYLFNDYGIKYEAAFSGCTSETDATYENIIKLCNTVRENNINSILVLEKSTSNVSSSIISTTKKELKIYNLNSLQTVSKTDIEKGLTFYNAMKSNIDIMINSISENQK